MKRKNLIKALAVLGAASLLASCSSKKANDIDLVVDNGQGYEVYEDGYIGNIVWGEDYCTQYNGFESSVNLGDSALYKEIDENNRLIEKLKSMYGTKEGTTRVIIFGTEETVDYEYSIIVYEDGIGSTVEITLPGGNVLKGVARSSILTYLCPFDSKSALELTREEMALKLEQ